MRGLAGSTGAGGLAAGCVAGELGCTGVPFLLVSGNLAGGWVAGVGTAGVVAAGVVAAGLGAGVARAGAAGITAGRGLLMFGWGGGTCVALRALIWS